MAIESPERTYGLAVGQQSGLARIQESVEILKLMRTFVKDAMQDGLDYGEIPGTGKATLLLPGAQKVAMYYNTAPEYVIQATELKDGHVEYIVTCSLLSRITGEKVAGGVGSCTSMEGKYRYRNQAYKCPSCGAEAIRRSKKEYGGGWYCNKKENGCGSKFAADAPAIMSQPEPGQIENPNVWDQRNTILKMAKKRAQVDAAMGLGCLAELFTQDIEDFYEIKQTAQGVRVSDTRTGEVIEQKPAPKPAAESPDARKSADPQTGDKPKPAALKYLLKLTEQIVDLRRDGSSPPSVFKDGTAATGIAAPSSSDINADECETLIEWCKAYIASMINGSDEGA